MKTETVQKLLAINRQFYQTFAQEFDATRQRVQPGVAKVLDFLPKNARILDLGCGNGEVARELARRGFVGAYVGVDFSEGLVEAARKNQERGIRNQEEGQENLTFHVADLTAADWEVGLEGPYDAVLAFAVLHHLPGVFHGEIVGKVRELLRNPHPSTTAVPFPKPKGTASAQDADVSLSIPTIPTNSQEFPFPKPKVNPAAQDADDSPSPSLLFSSSPLPLFIHSNWQFLNSPRWKARIQPWERVGLSASDVAVNDYLLDWRRGGDGLRYVHHFSEEELAKLAQKTGFEVIETYFSDGKEGNLALYQVWRPQ